MDEIKQYLDSIPFTAWKSVLGGIHEVVTIDKSIYKGRLYVVDPQTNTIVLVQDNGNSVIIPGHSVLKFSQQFSKVLSCSTSEDFLLSDDSPALTKEDYTGRKERLKSWLTDNGLQIEESDGVLKCQDDVMIESPYNADSCLCSNVILLERIRCVIKKMPEK